MLVRTRYCYILLLGMRRPGRCTVRFWGRGREDMDMYEEPLEASRSAYEKELS